MFNLQLVLYQRSGRFVEPPISGPRGACIGTVVLILGGGLIALLGREHIVVAVALTAVNVGSCYGCGENIYFYYKLLNQHEARLVESPHSVGERWRSESGSLSVLCLPVNGVLVMLSAIFLMQFPVEKDSYWYGIDMVHVQAIDQSTVPHKFFSPLCFTCVAIGISTLVNGGMVQDTVLKKSHSNFHWQVGLWFLAILVSHVYSFATDEAWVGFAVLSWTAAGAMTLHKTLDFFYEMDGQGSAVAVGSGVGPAASAVSDPNTIDLEGGTGTEPSSEALAEGHADGLPPKKKK